MNEDELLAQMNQFLTDDTRYLRAQNLSESDLAQAAASKAHHHYSGRWTDEEQQVIDAVSATYQRFFIISARGYSE